MDTHSENQPGATGTSGAETPRIQQGEAPAPPVVEKTREIAGQVAEQARQQVKSQLATGKERATDSLGSVSNALRGTGQQLRDQEQAAIAGYADSAAEMVENVSHYLRDHDIDRLVREAEDFARRQPALFVGGAFALGFLASRFLKSSDPSGGYRYGGSATSGYPGHRLPTTHERTASGTPVYDVPVSGTASPSVVRTGHGFDARGTAGTPPE